MHPGRKIIATVGGVLVALGTLVWLQFDALPVAGGLWVLGAMVAPLAAGNTEEGVEGAAFATVVSLPLVAVGFALVAALAAEGSLVANLGFGLLGVLIVLPIIKLVLAVPMLAVGAALGFVQGLLDLW